MNYEERYKQAIEAAKRELHCCGSLYCDAARQIFRLFPELRESEDEKWRKWLIGHLSGYINQTDAKYTEACKNAIAWLEKQGEQKSWSEEDEKMISLLIKIFEVNHPNDHFKVNPIGTLNMDTVSTKEIVDWLKLLKPNHWKPNKEQMKAIKFCCANFEEFDALKSLYNDLKNL